MDSMMIPYQKTNYGTLERSWIRRDALIICCTGIQDTVMVK